MREDGDPASPEEREGRKPPTGTSEPQGKEPGDRTGEPPHHALNNPVTDPDPTEWPDPYEKRPDPRGPEEEQEGGPRPPSTSEPPPPIGTDQVRAGEDDYPRSGKGRRQ